MKLNQVLNHPKRIAVLGGRFQPMHSAHYAVYKILVDTFGKNNTFIASSNKTSDDSPFTFDNKKLIATEIFSVPEDKFVYAKIPYQPNEILKNYNPDNDIFILALGEKDQDRLLDSPYFEIYSDDAYLEPFSKKGYIIVIPEQEDGLSASQIRAYFKVVKDISKKKEMFAKIYGKFNQTVFNLINSILS